MGKNKVIINADLSIQLTQLKHK